MGERVASGVRGGQRVGERRDRRWVRRGRGWVRVNGERRGGKKIRKTEKS